MSDQRRRSQRQTIALEELRNDRNSLLSWGLNDPVLRKLESYRLYRAGYAAADIAGALGLARPYLYELWRQLECEGVEGLVDKRCGSVPRKRTTVREAAVLRAKALHPERSDGDLASEFSLDRSTVYQLLKEHDLQDLHRVLEGTQPDTTTPTPPTPPNDGEKGGSRRSRVHTLSP